MTQPHIRVPPLKDGRLAKVLGPALMLNCTLRHYVVLVFYGLVVHSHHTQPTHMFSGLVIHPQPHPDQFNDHPPPVVKSVDLFVVCKLAYKARPMCSSSRWLPEPTPL
jgi:hypothetical protein